MHLVSAYINSAGKGTCYVCRAHRRSHDELILDFERDIDFEGCLQVCGPCIAEAAKLTGAISEATDLVRQELELERSRLADVEDELDAANRALDGLNMLKARRVRRVSASDEA